MESKKLRDFPKVSSIEKRLNSRFPIEADIIVELDSIQFFTKTVNISETGIFTLDPLPEAFAGHVLNVLISYVDSDENVHKAKVKAKIFKSSKNLNRLAIHDPNRSLGKIIDKITS